MLSLIKMSSCRTYSKKSQYDVLQLHNIKTSVQQLCLEFNGMYKQLYRLQKLKQQVNFIT